VYLFLADAWFSETWPEIRLSSIESVLPGSRFGEGGSISGSFERDDAQASVCFEYDCRYTFEIPYPATPYR
jgi:hypothetical protein